MTPRQQLDVLAHQKLLRAITPLQIQGAKAFIGHEEYWNFASNDYLGLTKHSKVLDAYIEGIQKFGAGSGASRLVTGTSLAHSFLEDHLAEVKMAEAALTFSSGYNTAISTIPHIVGKNDFVVLDRLSHACLIDAAKISGAKLQIFPHNRLDRLEQILSKIRSKYVEPKILVITESIFSMDGDLCPLREIVDLCEQWSAMLFLDEAHALGVIGQQGMGLAEKLGLQARIPFQMGTLSKAVGLSGGYIAASRDWIDLFINRSRPFIYSTAPPPALSFAANTALKIIRSDEGNLLRQRLFKNVTILKPFHDSAIIPFILGTNENALHTANELQEKGFLIPAIRYPTVAKGSARLRITLSAIHPPEIVEKLAQDLLAIKARASCI